jgi:hypothetical protein
LAATRYDRLARELAAVEDVIAGLIARRREIPATMMMITKLKRTKTSSINRRSCANRMSRNRRALTNKET